MPHRSGRRVVAIVALVAALLVTSFQGPARTNAHAPDIDRFLYALSQVESGGKYTARNKTSGAYGSGRTPEYVKRTSSGPRFAPGMSWLTSPRR